MFCSELHRFCTCYYNICGDNLLQVAKFSMTNKLLRHSHIRNKNPIKQIQPILLTIWKSLVQISTWDYLLSLIDY